MIKLYTGVSLSKNRFQRAQTSYSFLGQWTFNSAPMHWCEVGFVLEHRSPTAILVLVTFLRAIREGRTTSTGSGIFGATGPFILIRSLQSLVASFSGSRVRSTTCRTSQGRHARLFLSLNHLVVKYVTLCCEWVL